MTTEDDFDLSLEWEDAEAPARPLRFLPPGRCLVEVTTRTIQGRFLLLPRPEANEIIKGVLGRANHVYPAVRIVGYWFLSNHWEALLEVPDSPTLSAFMSHVNSNLARQLGALYRWSGPFWARRYRGIVVIGQKAQVRRLKYLLSQGTKENLVSRPAEWPGVSSLRATTTGRLDVGVWFDAKKEYQSRKQRLRRGQKPRPRGDFETKYEIRMHSLPSWSRLALAEQQRRAKALVEDIEAAAQERRRETGKAPLGVRKILEQDPQYRPRHVATSPAPFVHASSRREWRSFRDGYGRFLRRFRKAASQLLTGDLSALDAFPARCFVPRPPSGVRWAKPSAAAS